MKPIQRFKQLIVLATLISSGMMINGCTDAQTLQKQAIGPTGPSEHR